VHAALLAELGGIILALGLLGRLAGRYGAVDFALNALPGAAAALLLGWGPVAAVTERETEVLACLGEGLSNAQIASRLYLSEATVKGYVSRMLVKLGCANRTQAGLLAHDAGLAAPSQPRGPS
jgi:DNA-binding NarL/FixJ family response regulator